MTKKDFQILVEYLSKSWRGFFTKREQRQLASEYYTEYTNNKKGYTIEALIDGLLQDVANGSDESMTWLLKLTA